MMIDINVNFIHILAICNAILLAVACFLVARFQRHCRRLEAFWSSPTASALAEDESETVRAQLRAFERMESRIAQLQRTVHLSEIRIPQNVPAQERKLPIDNAVRMARSGASIADLTDSCGLNIGEAQLMQKLHGNSLRAATVRTAQ